MKTETRADVNGRVAKMFARLDTNHDGFITQAEIDALQAQRAQRMEQRAQRFDPSKVFDRLDLNHDGQITIAEAQAARSQHSESKGGKPAKASANAFSGLFARADTNKDGVITKAEFDAMGQQMKARMEQAGMARGHMGARLFETADTNKDGRVSLAEMQAMALSRFDKFDLNHDGALTPDERQQARQMFKAKRKN
ncbi:MAG TPA: EF-hand domain-containing protein [Sphingomicrobium sp.]|nr:EF-hand domain-containing protein [Sphingomicrobium sp.]